MGCYIYRVSAKRVELSDGREANLAVYAYKPFCGYGNDHMNPKMHFKSGCVASEKMQRDGRLTGLVVMEGKPDVYAFNGATFNDDWFADTKTPIEGVYVKGQKPVSNMTLRQEQELDAMKNQFQNSTGISIVDLGAAEVGCRFGARLTDWLDGSETVVFTSEK